jgi:hypothetical protein
MFNQGIKLMKDLEITQNNVWDYKADLLHQGSS